MRYKDRTTWYGEPITTPEHTKEAFIRYFEYGFEPGSFGTAVLANDLFRAAAVADSQNKKMLADIVMWIANNAPEGSYGNYDIVNDWVNHGPAFQAHQKALTFQVLSEE